MNFSCICGDRRQTEIALYLKKLGHNVLIFGLPKNNRLSLAKDLEEAIKFADALILPLPVSRDGKTVNAPLTNDVIFLQEIMQYFPKKIFGGILKPSFIEELNNNGISYYDYYKSEPLTVKNAVLTAEAALAIAINCTDRSIYGSNALVIGYGRIGKQIAKYLKVLGANVTASSRSLGTQALIEADGINAISTDNIMLDLSKFDYIINTAPSPIMDRDFFKNVKPDVFIEDLATDAGTDFSAASNYNIKAALYSGLPGKLSPITAAEFIAQEILNNISTTKRGNNAG